MFFKAAICEDELELAKVTENAKRINKIATFIGYDISFGDGNAM